MSRVKRLLDAMYARLLTPEDLELATGIPRCEVVTALRVFEALGIAEPVASDGDRRAYRLTRLGEKLYRALELVESLALEVGIGSETSHPSQAASAVEGSS